MTATTPLRIPLDRYRRRRDRYRARIVRQLRRLGYRPRDWAEARVLAERLTRGQ